MKSTFSEKFSNNSPSPDDAISDTLGIYQREPSSKRRKLNDESSSPQLKYNYSPSTPINNIDEFFTPIESFLEETKKKDQTIEEMKKEIRISQEHHSDHICAVKEACECPICADVLVRPKICSCGHTFCDGCISTWLKSKKSCPICRMPLIEVPVRNILLEKLIINQLMPHMDKSTEEYKELKKKIDSNDEMEKKMEDRIDRLKESIEKKQLPVIDIFKKYDPRTRARIQYGLKHSKGKARQKYCEMMGLTEDNIKKAKSSELMKACNNINIVPPIKIRREVLNDANSKQGKPDEPKQNARFFTDLNIIISKLMHVIYEK